MQIVYFILGIKRSGNHAILNWLYKMIPNYLHLNNLPLKLLNSFHYKKFLTENINIDNYIDKNWTHFSKLTNLIISLENQNIKKSSTLIKKFCNDLNIKSEIIMLVRSPNNNFASIWKIMNEDTELLKHHKQLWKEYAEEIINNIYLEKKIVINFDKWFMDQKYRLEITRHLNLNFDDENFDKIFKHGFSSFDGYKFKDCATKMDVLNRIDYYQNDINFLKLINEKEIIILWDKIKFILN